MSNRGPVLVAIDHATDVKRTIGVALSTAGASGADVHVVQVVPHSGVHVDERRDQRVDLADEFTPVQHATGGDGVRLRRVTLRGRPERAIPAYAQLHQATVLVVERDYGSSRFWRYAGIVDELARESPVPLLVLPKQRTPGREQPALRRIITPVDFSIASAVAVRTAVDLSHRYGARLTLVHALKDVHQGMVLGGGEAAAMMQRLPLRMDAVAERLRRTADFFGADDVEIEVLTGVADGAILDVAARREADMIVIGAAHRSWLDRMAFGSTLRRVLRQATAPVLVVPVTAGAHPWPVVEETSSRVWTTSTVDRVAA
jgi:nucleotide-binding universal stress UspA family protein